jgi:ABC-type glycerol-3-phosphate transport system substrate-binding protein
LGIALLPQNKGKAASPLFSTEVLLFNRASSPGQTELALKFAHFLTNAEQQTNYALTLRNFIPSHQKVQVDRQLYPRLGILIEQSKSAVGVAVDSIEQADKVEERGDILYRQVLSGEMEPREAASQLARVVRQEFQLK